MIEDEQDNEEETGHETEAQVDTSHNNSGKSLNSAAIWINENIYNSYVCVLCMSVL